MFALRQINSSKGEHNIYLGSRYSIIDRERTPEEFKRTLKHMQEPEVTAKKPYAYISDENGTLHPLYEDYGNYVMTDSGKTFENVSLNVR